MSETPWVHEGERPLQGILTRPGGESLPDVPVVLLLTGGILPRVGPHRFYVKLARRLAAVGFTVLRFDFYGLATPRDTFPDSPSHAERTRDGRLALDDLEAREGFRRFALIGMCRSATPAISLALEDPRVTHGVFINGHYLTEEEHRLVVPETHNRYRFRHYRERLRRPGSWRRFLTGRTRYGNLARVVGRRLAARLHLLPAPVRPEQVSFWRRLGESPLQAPLASQAQAMAHIEEWLLEKAAASGSETPSKS